LATSLTKTSKMFGYQLFLLTITILVALGLVTIMYRLVAFFIGTYLDDWITITIAVGYFGLTLIMMDILGYLSILANDVVDSEQKLKEAIMDLEILGDGKVAIIDGKAISFACKDATFISP
jgi:hypothetical protein